MRELLILVSNYALFILLVCLLAGMQSSLWHLILGVSSAPYLWLTVAVYWTLNRPITESVIMSYVVTFFIVTMSGMPLNMGFALLLATLLTIYLLKDRVLWSGVNSFMLACGIASLALPLYNFIFSFVLETRPLSNFHFFDSIIRSLLTAAAAMPLYYLFTWIDKLTMREPPKENESNVI